MKNTSKNLRGDSTCPIFNTRKLWLSYHLTVTCPKSTRETLGSGLTYSQINNKNTRTKTMMSFSSMTLNKEMLSGGDYLVSDLLNQRDCLLQEI